MKKFKRAVVFHAWGEEFIQEVKNCITTSKELERYHKILITDAGGSTKNNIGVDEVIKVDFALRHYLRKTELFEYLPKMYNSFLLLDTDTVVINDIEFGFRKAEDYGIAISPAPHYSLDYFFGFDKIMQKENVAPSGQLQYNMGVVFFTRSKKVKSVFKRYKKLAIKYQDIWDNDQPLFTLAMEQLNFNPYTLSISYNYRGFGDAISGIVRVWHSHGEVPENLNNFEKSWPPRRAIPGYVIPSKDRFFEELVGKMKILK